MEKIRVSKVDNVICFRQGKKFTGTLHLTAHHLIFRYPADVSNGQPSRKLKELWITYPIIAFCTYRPAVSGTSHLPTIRLRCRDFVFVAFHFANEHDGRAVYDSIRSLSCRVGRLEKLYAFHYKAHGAEKDIDGWNIYNPQREFSRQGIGPERGWRITNINSDYQYSPTYPSTLVVPAAISDNVLNYAGKFRSRVRIPVLSYLHPINNCSITRSSQPLVGVRGNRSVQDERLVAAICATSNLAPKPVRSAPVTPQAGRSTTDLGKEPDVTADIDSKSVDAEMVDEAVPLSLDQLDGAAEGTPTRPRVYGAQQHNLIIDARPTINAYAMQAVGKGSENMDNYRCASKKNLGIDNIHVMRKSLNGVVEAFKDTDLTPMAPSRDQLTKSGWIKHIVNMLNGSNTIVRTVGIMHSHVLIHCSDGWDRTSQLSALSQICLDPYFRTLRGFIVLVEKDWLSFGHMFRHRSGLFGSEKWFEIENERVGGENAAAFGTAAGGGNAFENALTRVQGFFGQKEAGDEKDDTSDSELEAHITDSAIVGRKKNAAPGKTVQDDKVITKLKEISPVFHQFLDATYQILHQYPDRFEFNERFLRRLLYHLYSCQYGTFLWDSEKERAEAKAKERTRSVWDYFLSREETFINPNYDSTVDDSVKGKERIIFPDTSKIRWWAESFGRTDPEMNVPYSASTFTPPTFDSKENSFSQTDHSLTESIEVIDATESTSIPAPAPPKIDDRKSNNAAQVSEGLPLDFDSTDVSSFASSDHPFAATPPKRSRVASPSNLGAGDRLAAGFAALGLGGGFGSPGRGKSPIADREMASLGGTEMK